MYQIGQACIFPCRRHYRVQEFYPRLNVGAWPLAAKDILYRKRRQIADDAAVYAVRVAVGGGCGDRNFSVLDRIQAFVSPVSEIAQPNQTIYG